MCPWGQAEAVYPSGVAREASGGTRSGAQALKAYQHIFAVIKKRVLSRNLDQSMLKNAYFLEKNLKKSPQRRGPQTPVCLRRLGATTSNLCVITPDYYYNFG